MGEVPENASGPAAQKKVDESWKQSVETQKTAPVGAAEAAPGEEAEFYPPAEFGFFLSTIGMQAMAALGEMPDPSGAPGVVDLKRAKYMIDIIEMLGQKTKGNLSAEELQMVEGLLYELRLKFVQKNSS